MYKKKLVVWLSLIHIWGVVFGLIEDKGYLLENPVHYRDGRTAGMQEKSFEKISREEFYRITGCQFMDFNTAFQVLSLAENRPELLERADRLLLVPDLFNYLLTGKKTAEYLSLIHISLICWTVLVRRIRSACT